MSESFSGLPAAFEGKQVHSSFCQVGAYVSQRQPMTIELGHSSEWSRGMTSGWKCVVLWVKKKDRTLRCRHFGNLERCFPELGSINKISQTLGHAKRELKKGLFYNKDGYRVYGSWTPGKTSNITSFSTVLNGKSGVWIGEKCSQGRIFYWFLNWYLSVYFGIWYLHCHSLNL